MERSNVEMTGAARLYRAASSDRRERGRSQGYASGLPLGPRITLGVLFALGSDGSR